MGIRPENGGDRLRTIWTPEMDRYFIDLMLEQVNRGNRFDDHLFSKRAWKQMILLFNAKFKFQCEKDVLKNRHKTLRNLYKAVKNLLDQRGFSWDEIRQMVTADNSVWDEYIKLHPDARSFRIKTIPYYNDLRRIYGDAMTTEKGDTDLDFSHLDGKEKVVASQPRSISEEAIHSLHETASDQDHTMDSQKETGEDASQAMTNVTGTTTCSRSRTYWQPPMDRYFIDLMLEQVRKGNQIDGVFRKQAWMEMIVLFNANFGFNYDMDILKNRYKTLRRQHNVIKNLLELNGFGWDEARQMVTADDYVWQDYIKAHTDARQFMTRPVPYYKDLCVICSDSCVEGDSFSILHLEGHEEKFHGGSKNSQSPGTSVSSEANVGDVLESSYKDLTTLSNPKQKRSLENTSSSPHSKRSRGKDEGMASALREMATAVSSLSDKKTDDENSSYVSIENVIAAVQALPDMDEDLILDACDFLEDEVKAKTFLALDVKLRKKWLVRKLRPQHQE